MSLEQIVRPSQLTDPKPSYAAMLPYKQASFPVDEDEYNFGKGDNDVFAVAGVAKTADIKLENGQENFEVKRKFDTVRVKSQDDPNTYVDTEVMTEYQTRNKINDERTIIRFTSPQSSENTEVIRRNQTRGT